MRSDAGASRTVFQRWSVGTRITYFLVPWKKNHAKSQKSMCLYYASKMTTLEHFMQNLVTKKQQKSMCSLFF
ncbi:hypothetical protein BGP_0109 [Beggiatoa sp. PS]|nr:hypothetical protein BGP_0109 [Beggiatoa sp. PS]